MPLVNRLNYPAIRRRGQSGAQYRRSAQFAAVTQGSVRLDKRTNSLVLCIEVTPRILRNDRITLDFRLSQSVQGSIIKQGDSQGVSINTEKIKTQVTIADGETIVLGGIFQHQKQRSHDRVPLLADIPLVGALFKRN